MIEPMRKIEILLFHKISDEFLNKLQNLGLLHIIEKKLEDQELILKAKVHKKINDYIKIYSSKEAVQEEYNGDIKNLLDETETVLTKLENLNNELFSEQKKFLIFQPWGTYDLETVEKLKSKNLLIKFYKVSTKVFNKLELSSKKNIIFELIHSDDNSVYFVLIGNVDSIPEIKVDEFVFPTGSYIESKNRIEEIKSLIQEEKAKIDSFSKYKNYILKNRNLLENDISFIKAKLSLENNFDKILSIEAWIPSNKEKPTKIFLDGEDAIYYTISDPNSEISPVEIPILLKNNKYAKLFEPITKLFSLPNYVELDVTPYFAPFFMMFFGLCLGDSGYGLILLAASIFIIIKNKKLRGFGFLGIFFSLCTILWGVLTGTFFGINLFDVKIPFLSQLAIFPSEHMFFLALLIGLFQILFGMVVQFFNKLIHKGFMSSISTLGWIILIFFIVGIYLRGQNPAKGFYIGAVVINFYKSLHSQVVSFGALFGVLLILFFNDMKAKLPLRIGKGLWELYGVTGFFGDLLSYIRLFALGISSAILGTVVNALGASILETGIPVVSHLVFIVFLFVGHTGNLMLASLGAFVHSLRLTFVEFYKNAGFVGGGKSYTPFAKKDL